MKFLLCIPVLILSIFMQPGMAQEDVAHQRAVYTEVNKNAAQYKQVAATYKNDELVFELNGWFDGAELRKIVATVPGEDGAGSDEFYLEGGKLVFVFNSYSETDRSKGPKTENRLYFKAGKMVHWIGNDKKPVSPKSEDFKLEADRLTGNVEHFITALKEKIKKAPPAKETAAALQTLEGVFTGIEEGDYIHWAMKSKDGKKSSFFVLHPEASVEKAIEEPGVFVGKKCRIKWKKSVENLPEAGGKTEVEQIISVEWIGGK